MNSAVRVRLVVYLVLVQALVHIGAPTAPSDLAAIKDFYHSTNGSRWREGFTWQTGIEGNLDPCDNIDYYKGLACDKAGGDPDRQVTQVWLSAMHLEGPLPPNFGDMTKVTSIYLTSNNLTGAIPETMCNMTGLLEIELSHNQLTGTIPNCISKLQSLQKWDTRNNMLTGTIPVAFGVLSELQSLFLSSNQLSGTIPAALFDAKRIEILFLSYNQLEGTVPRIFSRYKIKETPSMQGLSWMDIRSNKLQGTYPDILALLAAV